MPINFDLESIRKKYKCVNYLETGLYDPRENVSSKLALASDFDKVISIEIRADFCKLAETIFKHDIETGRFTLINDDSTNIGKYLKHSIFQGRTVFFLDAHVDNHNIINYKKKCPLFDELEAIKSLPRNDNIILIDDLRILCTPTPWGEESYGNINFLKEIMKKIYEINSEYKFELLNGYVKDDVLMCYV